MVDGSLAPGHGCSSAWSDIYAFPLRDLLGVTLLDLVADDVRDRLCVAPRVRVLVGLPDGLSEDVGDLLRLDVASRVLVLLTLPLVAPEADLTDVAVTPLWAALPLLVAELVRDGPLLLEPAAADEEGDGEYDAAAGDDVSDELPLPLAAGETEPVPLALPLDDGTTAALPVPVMEAVATAVALREADGLEEVEEDAEGDEEGEGVLLTDVEPVLDGGRLCDLLPLRLPVRVLLPLRVGVPVNEPDPVPLAVLLRLGERDGVPVRDRVRGGVSVLLLVKLLVPLLVGVSVCVGVALTGAPALRLPLGEAVTLGAAVPELLDGTGAPPDVRTTPLSKLMRSDPVVDRV